MPPSPLPSSSDEGQPLRLDRRGFLMLGVAGAVVVGGGAAGVRLLGQDAAQTRPPVVGPHAPIVKATEAARYKSGRVVRQTLRASPTTVDLGGKTLQTWAFNGSVPGPQIRVRPGDELRVHLVNDLPETTTVHWHGLGLRNDMDGVPDVTMKAVPAGGNFDYSFVVPHSGTYWYHPHVGVQLDMGLQGALIVDDPADRGDYDVEAVLILDDWTDGLGDSPSAVLDRLSAEGMDMAAGMNMGDMGDMTSDRQPLGKDTGDVAYPTHVINGRLPQSPVTVHALPGQRIRFRLINAGSDTAYRFAIGGHRMLVTHADGYAVQPVEVDALILGMGERYDVEVTAADGAFAIVAAPEGKPDPAGAAVLRTGAGLTPPSDARPVELSKRLLAYDDLEPVEEAALRPRTPDRELELSMAMVDGGRQWYLNGAAYGDNDPLLMRAGERVRLTMRNETMMFHPMHLHGHTFAVVRGSQRGVRKDTVNVLPMQSLAVDLQADNPGSWLLHCHNLYHQELGMASVLAYLA